MESMRLLALLERLRNILKAATLSICALSSKINFKFRKVLSRFCFIGYLLFKVSWRIFSYVRLFFSFIESLVDPFQVGMSAGPVSNRQISNTRDGASLEDLFDAPPVPEDNVGVQYVLYTFNRIDTYVRAFIDGPGVPDGQVYDFYRRVLSDRYPGQPLNVEQMRAICNEIHSAGGIYHSDLVPSIHKIWNEIRMEQQSPLDQFSIDPFLDLHIGSYYFSFTNLSLSMLLTVGLILLLLYVVTKKGGGKLVPNAWQSLVELIYDFVLNLVKEQIGGLSGNVQQRFFPCILVTFTFLLFCNLQGMIPFSFTVTSHFLITLALSFSIFIGITIVGFQRHGLHFFSFLLPAGVPLPLAPFLVLLELISYCFRALSLGIRLFANMMAGHSLVKILSGFAWTMLFLNNIFYFIGDLGPLFLVLALTGLELGVAILQAYVFTILICIYLNDAINLH